METKYFEIKSEALEIAPEERAIIHYITTKDIDRDNDIVEPLGMDDTEFSQAPTVLYNHNSYYPIAKSLWRKEKENGILAKTSFSKTSFADDVYTLHKEGIINTWSIGFVPIIKSDGTIDPDSVQIIDGLRIFKRWKLYEYSSAPIPANPHALDVIKSVCKSNEMGKLIDEEYFRAEIKKQLQDQENLIKELQQLKEELEMLKEFKTTFSKIETLENEIKNLNNKIQLVKAETLDSSTMNKIIVEAVREVSLKNRKFKQN